MSWFEFRRMLGYHPLDYPKLPERRPRSSGKRVNSPLLWLQADGSRV